MSNVRRGSVLFLEVPFLKISEPQHGSSWAKKFLKTMGSLFLAYPWQERLNLIQKVNQYMGCCQADQPMENHMKSHQDVQEALSRERNLPICGNSNVHPQEVPEEEPQQDEPQDHKTKTNHLLKNKSILLKMIPWVKR
jgi:hypothetical protein